LDLLVEYKGDQGQERTKEKAVDLKMCHSLFNHSVPKIWGCYASPRTQVNRISFTYIGVTDKTSHPPKLGAPSQNLGVLLFPQLQAKAATD